MQKDITSIVEEIRKLSLYDIAVPVMWGLLNSLAGIISIPIMEKTEDVEYIWSGMILIGIIGNIIIRRMAIHRKGFTLLESKIIGYIWNGIIVGIIISTSIIYKFIGFKEDWDLLLYIFSNVSLLIGIGLYITGFVIKRKETKAGYFVVLAGVLWLSFSIFGVSIREKTLFFGAYSVVSFISLVLLPIMGYLWKKRKITM